MQEENTHFSQLFSRISFVRGKLGLTWDELANRVGCNRSLFFQIKRGNCGMGYNKLMRLEELEREAGILTTHTPSPLTRNLPNVVRDADLPPIPKEVGAEAVLEYFGAPKPKPGEDMDKFYEGLTEWFFKKILDGKTKEEKLAILKRVAGHE